MQRKYGRIYLFSPRGQSPLILLKAHGLHSAGLQLVGHVVYQRYCVALISIRTSSPICVAVTLYGRPPTTIGELFGSALAEKSGFVPSRISRRTSRFIDFQSRGTAANGTLVEPGTWSVTGIVDSGRPTCDWRSS